MSKFVVICCHLLSFEILNVVKKNCLQFLRIYTINMKGVLSIYMWVELSLLLVYFVVLVSGTNCSLVYIRLLLRDYDST
jgi:hypothetical protein